MSNHFEHSECGFGVSRRHARGASTSAQFLALTLDAGDRDEFTFAAAGGFACSRGVRPQGEITVAA